MGRPSHRPVVESVESRLLFSGLDGSEVAGLPADMKASVYTFVGDHGSSNSEKWTLNVGGHTFATSAFGEVRRDLTEYKKGESYPITVNWNDTNRLVDGQKKPDYDYRAWVDKSATPAWTSGPTTVSGPTYFATDPAALLQKRWFGDDQNAAAGKTALLHFPAVDLNVDSDNNDGFAAPAGTTAEAVLEEDPTKGKFVYVSGGDYDGDGVPDFADTDGSAGRSFVPVTVKLSANLAYAQPSAINFTFDYDGSDPSPGADDRHRLAGRAERLQARPRHVAVVEEGRRRGAVGRRLHPARRPGLRRVPRPPTGPAGHVVRRGDGRLRRRPVHPRHGRRDRVAVVGHADGRHPRPPPRQLPRLEHGPELGQADRVRDRPRRLRRRPDPRPRLRRRLRRVHPESELGRRHGPGQRFQAPLLRGRHVYRLGRRLRRRRGD